MGRKLSKADEAKLKRKGSLVELDESDSQPFMTYHDPETGQEFPRLPADQHHLVMYIAEKGWRPGPAPEHLREKWEAGREEREREYEARLENTRKSKEFKELRDEARKEADVVSRSEVEEIVETTLLRVLRKAGMIPNEPEPEPEIEEPEEAPYKEVDAPPESDTKLMVSQASLDVDVQEEEED